MTTARVQSSPSRIFATAHTLSSSQLGLKVKVFHLLFCVSIAPAAATAFFTHNWVEAHPGRREKTQTQNRQPLSRK